jgi:spermidine/putrescine transport system ATP-binding protein
MHESGLTLAGVSKQYGDVTVLEPLDLTVEDGEFLTILGPSGSGKTTILRLIGGFTEPTAGRIVLEGEDITARPINRRPFNTVFQDYALFPHMTVGENVGYGLMVRHTAKAQIRARVAEVLRVVALDAFVDRYPAQLSGGQKQRVALARAIICEPKIILLDEPLAALDAELRRQMQLFLKRLQKQIRTTFLFVTHDQEEAITMSDRIVVMNAGRIEQTGTPREIYYRPRTAFVAGFFGDNNLIDGTVESASDGWVRVDTAFGHLPVPGTAPPGRNALVAIRPESVRLMSAENPEQPSDIGVMARVDEVIFVGSTLHIVVRSTAVADKLLRIKVPSSKSADAYAVGQAVRVGWAAGDAVVVPL